MATATIFEGAALQRQIVAERVEVQSHPRILPSLCLFLVLIAQLSVRIMVVDRAYQIEELRTTALRNDVVLRELKSRYSLLAGPSQVTVRAKSTLQLVPLSPQRMRKFVLPETK
jgi:hypothetical protein